MMEKAQLPVFAELSLGDTEDFTGKPSRKFVGTENPRYLRAIQALRVRPLPREQLDRIAGCSNGPALIAELRALGLGAEGLPCTKVPDRDRDGRSIRRGVYSLSVTGRRAVDAWLRKQKGNVQ